MRSRERDRSREREKPPKEEVSELNDAAVSIKPSSQITSFSFQAMPWDKGKTLDELLELFVERVTDSGGLVEKSKCNLLHSGLQVLRDYEEKFVDIMDPRIGKPGAGKRGFRNPAFDGGGNPWRR